jgi:multiple sugar transport system permease protein
MGLPSSATQGEAVPPARETPLREPVAPLAREAGRPRRTLNVRFSSILALLGPFAILFVLVYLVPMVYAVVQSLFVLRRNGAYGAPFEAFGGLTNYARAFQDSDFTSSLLRMLLFGVVQVPVMLLLALIIALLLDAVNLPFRRFFRTSAFMPYAVPSVIGAIMWGFLYTPGLSPLSDALSNVGVNPLGPGWILWSIANVVTWTWTGYNALIIYSSLQTIDPVLYEAARIDGARPWQIALRIKVPIVRPAVIMTILFSIVGTLQLFTEPQILSTVSNAISTTYTPNMTAYAQASTNNYSYSAALSVIIALLTGVLSITLLRATQRKGADA